MTPSLSDVGSGTIVSAVVGLGSGDRAPPRCPSPASSTMVRRSVHLRAGVVFRVNCAARRRIFFPKSSSWSMRLRRRARDGRRAWDCRARDFDRVSGRRQQPRQCSARRCCGELQKSFAAAEASCTPLLLVLWTMGCVCVLGVVAARPGLIGVPWSPHKPTGKRGLDVLSAVAKRDVQQSTTRPTILRSRPFLDDATR